MFVEISEERGGAWDSTSNMIEDGANARLREMLRMHQGLSMFRRIKAIFWRRCMHTESPLPPAEILRITPTGSQADGLFAQLPAGASEMTKHPRTTGQGLSGANSTYLPNSGSE